MKTFIIIMALASSFAFAQTQKKFPAGEDLKSRMEMISVLIKDLNSKKADLKIMSDSGIKISKVVSDIFKTCKLEPAADKAIHPVLAKILEGSGDLKNGHLKDGDAKIHQALLEYEKLFQVK